MYYSIWSGETSFLPAALKENKSILYILLLEYGKPYFLHTVRPGNNNWLHTGDIFCDWFKPNTCSRIAPTTLFWCSMKLESKEEENILLVPRIFSYLDIEKASLSLWITKGKEWFGSLPVTKQPKHWQKEFKPGRNYWHESTAAQQLIKVTSVTNQTLINIILDLSKVISPSLVCTEVTLHSWR